jgi:HK97 family phage major capsid protein
MAFDLETAFNKFQGDVMNKLSEQDDKIKRLALVKKTGAVPNAPLGTPYNPATPGFGIRRSNDPAGVMNSKGFSFAKVMLHVSDPRMFKADVWCPNEMAVMDHFTKSVVQQKYSPVSGGFGVAPIFPEMLSYGDEGGQNFSTSEILGYKAYIDGGTEGTDQGEIEWLQKTFNYGQKAAANVPSPTQAAFADASLGGSLIGPPTFGPPIELLRNVEALMNAGATTMPIGPTGSFLMPKLVAPTVATLVGENRFVTPTTYQTGQIELRAKKIMALVVMPGELLRFGGPGVEMLTRNDMMKSVALGMDYYLLFGSGSNIQPLGLYTMAANTATTNGGIYVAPTAGVPGRSGYGVVIIQPSNTNQLSPQDIYDFEAGIEQNNGEANGYIMAPTMFAGFRKARWTPYSGGTSQGAFTFDLTRLLEGTTKRGIDGRPVTVTNQIPVTMLSAWTGTGSLSGGTYTNLIAGDFTRYVITLFGGIEFAQETGGIQLFGADQVAVRALASFDGCPQYPGLFALANPAANILPTLIN